MKIWHIQTMEYYVTARNNEIMQFEATWMEPRRYQVNQSKPEGQIQDNFSFL